MQMRQGMGAGVSAKLYSKVQATTALLVNAPGYAEHAAHESMTAYLEDWEKAATRLNNAIARLREMRDERLAAEEAGEWP